MLKWVTAKNWKRGLEVPQRPSSRAHFLPRLGRLFRASHRVSMQSWRLPSRPGVDGKRGVGAMSEGQIQFEECKRELGKLFRDP